MRGNDSYQVKQLKLWIGAQEFIVHFEPKHNGVLDSDEDGFLEPAAAAAEEIICQVLLLFQNALPSFFRKQSSKMRDGEKFRSFCTWHISYRHYNIAQTLGKKKGENFL